MLKIIKASAAMLLITLVSGCAVGVTHQYNNTNLTVKSTQNSKIGIGVQDKRIYVVTKEKPESFVGISRGGFGNPFVVKTASGAPLANDFAQTIQAALSKNEVEVQIISLPIGTNQREAINRLVAKGNKAILIEINEWKSDTYMSTILTYDIQALVIDTSGDVISSKKIAGSDNLGGSAMNPPAHSRKAVPIAFIKKLEELFSAPEIANHL